MKLYEKIKAGEANLSLVGLGYVGLPIAVAFAKVANVIGFDINAKKIDLYMQGVDPTEEVGDEGLRNTTVDFTSDPARLSEALFHIIAVPTPINDDHTPDLTPLISASRLLGPHLRPGSIVVYESTVYPGLTEEVCIPLLEQTSGLVMGKDFTVGYSPERINPGDKRHRLETIVKVVSGSDRETLDEIAAVYEMVIDAGVYRASSIKVAEAAKVIENSQRDINIAFMNELSIIFHKMGIDTKEVLEAAGTKWNFLPFSPGLVGGHCIGVDPYYLTYKAEALGYSPHTILSGRRVNNFMGEYVAESAVKLMLRQGLDLRQARMALLGVTFKENCPDTRNTRVFDIVHTLAEYNLHPMLLDAMADPAEVRHISGHTLAQMDAVQDMDVLIFAVAHDDYRDLTPKQLLAMYRAGDGPKVLIDVKGMFDKDQMEAAGLLYWRL